MAKWLQSGPRRDLCVLLSGSEGTAQRLKSRLEEHYDERIDPKTFYAQLSALEDAGLVEKRVEGLADVYSLTEAGERALRDHYEWMTEQLE